MGAEIVRVGSVEEYDLDVKEMKVDSSSIVGNKNILGKDVGRHADMFGFHEHILSNFQEVGFGLDEETNYTKE